MQESFRNREHSVIKEVLGIIAFAVAVYLFIVVITYNKEDTLFSSSGFNPTNIKNQGGIVGAKISDTFLQGIGLGVYLLIILLFLTSLKLVFVKNYKAKFTKTFSILTFVLSVSSLISLLFSNSANFERIGYKPGGWLGNYISMMLSKYLNTTGAFLVIGSSVILSIMLFENISFIPIFEKILGTLRALLLSVKDSYVMRRERAKKTKVMAAKIKIQEKTMVVPKISEPEAHTKETVKKEKPVQAGFGFLKTEGFTLPPLDILVSEQKRIKIDKESLLMNSKILEKKLLDYGVEGKVVEVHPGPVVTQYEFEPAPGVKVSKVANLQDDLAMALRAVSIRIVAPIPGKSVVGIEIPNNNRETVFFREILESESFIKSDSVMTLALGKDIAGIPVSTTLDRMPHLLIAGATGSGKSVGLNTMIASILYKATPDEVRFILIDPKMLELITYEDIPHLLLPVVVDPKKASAALRWAVTEMERRYKTMSKSGVRNINSYNAKLAKELAERAKKKRYASDTEVDPTLEEEKVLPYIVVVIDELADLMAVAGKEVEKSIARLAQMARAAGIHLIVATQRPSVDVLTGLIKANFPARLSFQVSARTDSRTILDSMGAEQLLGRGDMLFLPPGTSKIQRVHGAYLSDKEVEDLVAYLRSQGAPQYDEQVMVNIESEGDDALADVTAEEYDEKYDEALRFVSDLGQASISLVQRKFKIGYNRAARIIEQMERDGVVGPSDGSKPRQVLANKQ